MVDAAVGATGTPVNVGDANAAFKSNAVCVALEIGLFTSDVLSTLVRPTISLEIPLTVPVKVGDTMLAFKSNAASNALTDASNTISWASNAFTDASNTRA